MGNKPSHNFVIYISIMTALFIVSFFSNSISIFSKEQVAAVSNVGATISETPTNKLAMELREYGNELTAKELSLKEREIALIEESERVKNYTRNVIIGIMSLSLITLLLTNLYLHWRNKKHTSSIIINSKYGYSAVHIPKYRPISH
jgi:hypothetical protein